MDRKIYKLPFTATSINRYQCPTCNNGVLQILDGTFFSKETKESLSGHDHPEFGPEFVEYIYSCIFQCSNTTCKEVVSSSGKGYVEEYNYYNDQGEHERDYCDYYKPQVFTPHLKVFECPVGTPENAIAEINASFSLLLIDPPSSANHIRIAIEHLLTHLGIKEFDIKEGKNIFIPLHKRINLLPTKYDSIKDIFIAVKWLGNAGSHSSHKVTYDDVMDSYELTLELLDEIFSTKRLNAKSLAQKINVNKGPK
ncbi:MULTISPECIES: DUF4145 domain-containing protein [Photobacterium]|uniref:DUF4145 domain-containing protein n=1 Tax=Photobacterium TaxID=657 RepID=UPI00210F7128|nr:DUF4145 domain-containing protein [Photobacterium toruni]